MIAVFRCAGGLTETYSLRQAAGFYNGQNVQNSKVKFVLYAQK